MSAIFADQVAINSSSNATLPVLWQLPIDFTGEGKRRKRRDVDYFEDDESSANDIFATDYEAGDDLGFFDGISSAFHLGKIATRFRNGMILYALMDSDQSCRYCRQFSAYRDRPWVA